MTRWHPRPLSALKNWSNRAGVNWNPIFRWNWPKETPGGRGWKRPRGRNTPRWRNTPVGGANKQTLGVHYSILRFSSVSFKYRATFKNRARACKFRCRGVQPTNGGAGVDNRRRCQSTRLQRKQISRTLHFGRVHSLVRCCCPFSLAREQDGANKCRNNNIRISAPLPNCCQSSDNVLSSLQL